MIARRSGAAALGVLVMLVPGSATDAATRLELGIGMTAASSDGPKTSGAAVTASALWELMPKLDFGVMLYADDLGSKTGRLLDPNDGTDLGAVAEDHRTVMGGAWRVDLPITRGARWRSELGATWGYYRIQDDRIGVVQSAISSTGWSAGVSGSRRLRPTTALGLSVRLQALPDKRQDFYVRAAVDLSWLPSATAGDGTPGKATPGSEN